MGTAGLPFAVAATAQGEVGGALACWSWVVANAAAWGQGSARNRGTPAQPVTEPPCIPPPRRVEFAAQVGIAALTDKGDAMATEKTVQPITVPVTTTAVPDYLARRFESTNSTETPTPHPVVTTAARELRKQPAPPTAS